MGNFTVVKPKTSAATVMSRELSLAADRSLWAGDQTECIAIIAQIYGLFDDLNGGIPPIPAVASSRPIRLLGSAAKIVVQTHRWCACSLLKRLTKQVWSSRIFFAEDDLDLRSIVTELLCAEGFEVTMVESGDQAAVVLGTAQFNLLLPAITAWRKDGVDLALYAISD